MPLKFSEKEYREWSKRNDRYKAKDAKNLGRRSSDKTKPVAKAKKAKRTA